MAEETRRESTRSTHLPEPTTEVITYRRQKITPGLILRLWRSGMAQKQESRKRILEARAFRRMEEASRIQLAAAWVRLHPEAAEWVVEVLEERITLDSNMIARAGAVEPEYIREPLGFRDTDREHAEELESYLNEWKLKSVPFQTFIGKNTEDGEFGLTVLPAHLDMDGAPTFFETLEERAYELLDEDAKADYVEDEDYRRRQERRAEQRRRKRYIKTDEQDGRRVKRIAARYDRGGKDENERTQRATEAHKEAISRYLLGKDAANVRVIPALDCAPIFDRGKGRDRWALSALVERTLYTPEELIEQEYGWRGMGDRKLVPQAYNADGSKMSVRPEEVGEKGQIYLYTAYLVCKDDDGHERPVIAYTIGGTGTALGSDREPDDPDAVGLIDLFAETAYTDEQGRQCGLEGPLWSYHFGLHGEDDSPDHYGRPYIYPFIRRIRAIEGNKTAINAATEQNAFTGHFYTPDARLAEHAPEAIIEGSGELIRPQMPRAGEIRESGGAVVPAQQARVGQDAWQQLAADMQSLAQNTAIDMLPGGEGQSGHAMLVQSTMGQVGKRHIREGALDAVVKAGEFYLKILAALYYRHGVSWPIQTTQERPIGTETREGRAPVEFNIEWLGEDKQVRLAATYPEEENLARIDLEASLADRGYGNVERVHRAMGESDSDRARLKSDRDFLLKQPPVVQLRLARVAKKIGDRELQSLLRLQAAQEMSQAEVPGISGGIPTAALKRQGQGAEGQGPGSAVSGIRGGVEAAQIGGDRMMADAQASLTQNGTAA